jgi:hypothetical protein
MENQPTIELDAPTFEAEIMRLYNEKFSATPASDEDMKRAIDFQNMVPPVEQRQSKMFMDTIANYLTFPIITDNFADNKARIVFLQKLKAEPELREFYQTNKLKRDNMNSVFMALSLLSNQGELTEVEDNKLNKFFESIQAYNDLMPLAEKLAYVEEVTKFCRKFIDRQVEEFKS